MSGKKLSSSKVYFGWWTVLATGILSGFGHGFYGSGVSVFFKDVAAEFGASRALVAFASGLGRLEGGITSPLTGWLSDRYGPKYVIFSGICITGIGLILMNFVPNVWWYILIWGLFIGVGLDIGLTIAVDKALNDWFIFKRGLAQGTKFGLIGVGSVAVLPLVAFLVSRFGWRSTCLFWGCFMLTCSPLALIFVKQKRPEHYGLLPDGAKPEPMPPADDSVENGAIFQKQYQVQEMEFTFKQAARTRTYWLMAAAFGLQMFVMGGISIHLIPFLTDIGLSRARASGLMGLMVFFTIPSRFFSGIIADRVAKKHLNFLMTAAYLIQAFGLSVFLLSRSIGSLYVFLVLYGLSSGASTPLFILILGRYYGRKAFGTIFGSSMAIRAPISLTAPVFSGWIFDTTGSYVIALVFFVAIAVLAAALMSLVRPVEAEADD